MSTPLDQITRSAAQRLRYRESMVAPVVNVVAKQHRNGKSTTQIVAYLQGVFVDDAPQAQPDFVTFITDQL
jgi:hypothetical protein